MVKFHFHISYLILLLIVKEITWPLAMIFVSAQALEEMLYLYFSHPAVEGIILWGFWDGRIWKDGMRLVEGPDLTVRVSRL